MDLTLSFLEGQNTKKRGVENLPSKVFDRCANGFSYYIQQPSVKGPREPIWTRRTERSKTAPLISILSGIEENGDSFN